MEGNHIVTAREILSDNEQECPVYTTRPRKSVSGALWGLCRMEGARGVWGVRWLSGHGAEGGTADGMSSAGQLQKRIMLDFHLIPSIRIHATQAMCLA